MPKLIAFAFALAATVTLPAITASATEPSGHAPPPPTTPAAPRPAHAPHPSAGGNRQPFIGRWEGQAIIEAGEACRIAVDARTITSGCRDPEGEWHMAEFNSGTCPQLLIRIESPTGSALRHDLTAQADGPVAPELTAVLDTLAPETQYPTLDLWCPYQDGGVTITLVAPGTLLGFVFHGAERLHDIIRYTRQP